MNEVWLVVINSNRYHKGELYTHRFEMECDNLVNATRCMLTYKPKRGYKVDHVSVKLIDTLC